jgi:hypothetical protein
MFVIDEPIFEIGQLVVCLEPDCSGLLNKGEIYKISETKYCPITDNHHVRLQNVVIKNDFNGTCKNMETCFSEHRFGKI